MRVPSCAQIVQPLLQSGVLPLSSLELVGGKSTERNHEYSHRTRAWWNNVERVAVAVLKGSPGYTELHEAWAKAGLTVHSCQVSALIQTYGSIPVPATQPHRLYSFVHLTTCGEPEALRPRLLRWCYALSVLFLDLCAEVGLLGTQAGEACTSAAAHVMSCSRLRRT